jgi:hypothetical protein
MKKWLIGLGIVGFLLGVAAFSVVWVAMAQASLRVIDTNAAYTKQQLYYTQYQSHFDYDRLEIGMHFLSPKIIMHKPVLQFAANGTIYHLRADTLEFIGSFRQIDRYELILPSHVVLEKGEGKKPIAYQLTLHSSPSPSLKSATPAGDSEPTSVLLNQLTLDDTEGFAVDILAPQAGATTTRHVFTPPAVLSRGWHPIRYEFYSYLDYFADTIEQTADAQAPLHP